MAVPAFSLAGGRRSLAGSMIGGIAETQEMLDFCAEHGVRPEIEVIAARLHQRGLRARAGQRRALPLRHRHLNLARLNGAAVGAQIADCGPVDTVKRPAGGGQLGGDPLNVLRTGVVM